MLYKFNWEKIVYLENSSKFSLDHREKVDASDMNDSKDISEYGAEPQVCKYCGMKLTQNITHNGLIIMDKKFSDNIMCIVSLKKFYHLKLFEKC